MTSRLAILAATTFLAGCASGAPSANIGNEAQADAIQGAPANSAAANSAAAAAGAIQVPTAAELRAAMATITDEQLAAQVAPDGDYDAAECVVHIALLEPVPAGLEQALDRAGAAWRARVVRELGEEGAAQMIGSSVNPLTPTPPALRQAAAAWCLANAPSA
jgi:hypothetical protein